MISDNELLFLEKNRQDDSDYVLQRIDLLDKLKKYGEVHVVGAKALGLMIAKDIDIFVVVEKIDYGSWKSLVGELMETPHVRKVTAIDYYNYDDKNNFNPEHGQKYSLYVQMDTLMGRNGKKFDPWDCQIHLINRKTFDQNIVKATKSKLTPDNRLTVLRIKYWANAVNKRLLEVSGGHFKIQSTDIYPLVLSGKVKSIKEFISVYWVSVPDKFRKMFGCLAIPPVGCVLY